MSEQNKQVNPCIVNEYIPCFYSSQKVYFSLTRRPMEHSPGQPDGVLPCLLLSSTFLSPPSVTHHLFIPCPSSSPDRRLFFPAPSRSLPLPLPHIFPLSFCLIVRPSLWLSSSTGPVCSPEAQPSFNLSTTALQGCFLAIITRPPSQTDRVRARAQARALVLALLLAANIHLGILTAAMPVCLPILNLQDHSGPVGGPSLAQPRHSPR